MSFLGVEASRRLARERAEAYVGQTFGQLTILEVYQRFPPALARVRRVARVRCSCGEERVDILLDNILRGGVRSCGCWDSWASRYGARGTHERRRVMIRSAVRAREHMARYGRMRLQILPGPTPEEINYVADLVCTTRERPMPWDGELAPWGDDNEGAADAPPEGEGT